MLDDDTDDLYLLEAVESVENFQSKNVTKFNNKQYSEGNSQTLATSSVCPQMTDLKCKGDFRSRLLLTLSSRENKPECLNGSKINEPIINSVDTCINSSTASSDTRISYSLLSSNFVQTNPKDGEIKLLKKINSSVSVNVAPVNSFDNDYSKIKLSTPLIVHENKIENSLTPTFRKRKFPGPAGILPNWRQESSFCHLEDVNLSIQQQEKKKFCAEDTICSQKSAEEFWGAWKKMISDFHALFNCNPLECVNIKWLLRRVTFRGDVVSQKIPFLVVMVHSIDLSHQDATVVFKDETGQMNGIISSSLIDSYSTLISQGTVMVLKDATILSPAGFRICSSLKEQHSKHYIIVTSNSLLTLYSQDNDAGKIIKTEIATLKEDELKLLLTKNVKYVEPKAVVEENEQEIENEDLERSFFSNVNFSPIVSDKHNTIQNLNAKLPLKEFISSTDSPTAQFPNNSRFSLAFNRPMIKNLKSMSPYSNEPILKSSSNTTCISKMENRLVPNSNVLANINNVKISRPRPISLTSCDSKINDSSNMQVINKKNIFTYNPNHNSANDKINGPLQSPKYSCPAVTKSNANFKFVNKNLFNNTAKQISDDCLVPKQLASPTSSNRSNNIDSYEKNGLLGNLPNTREVTSNNSNMFDDEDDDDFEFLLSNIDTDSILNIK